MKRLFSILLVLTLLITSLPIISYAQRDFSKQELMAKELKELGLFRGVSETNFDLERAPSRVEAVVMLVRALGKEETALNGDYEHPFSDVPAWADKYIGYAYAEKLTNGQSDNMFGNTDAGAAVYITFVLRALGYSDAQGDFTWDNPFMLAKETGLLTSDVDIENFTRADVVTVTHNALAAYRRGLSKSLSSKLIAENVFSRELYDKVYNSYITTYVPKPETAEILSSEEIYEKCKSSVIYIEVYDEYGELYGAGSGFFIDDKGTAVTNYHIIRGAYFAYAQVLDSENKVYEVLGVYDYSADNDWAVIKIDCEGNDYLKINIEEVVGGSEIYTIGNPKGLKCTMSEGIVSNPSRVVNGTIYIQISAPISSGSSGGALINKNGDVIGITSGGMSDSQNLNMALPLLYVIDYENESLTTLSEIAYWEKHSFDFWFSKEFVVVEKGKTEYVLFDYSHDFDVPEPLDFTIVSGNAEVAIADWENFDDEPTPWGIEIQGISEGETGIVIANNFNQQLFVLPVIVVEKIEFEDPYDYLASWVKAYGLKTENTYMTAMGGTDQEESLLLGYNVEEDFLFVMCTGIYDNSDTAYVSIIYLPKANGTSIYAYTQEGYNSEESMFLYAENIVPSEMTPYPYIQFTQYDCPEVIKGGIEILANVRFTTTLYKFDEFLKYYVGCITTADFGFTSIYPDEDSMEGEQ